MKLLYTSILCACFAITVFAQSDSEQKVNLHFQTTYIYQYKPAFQSPYEGPHSLLSKEEKQNSLTATMYLAIKLWHGAALFINPEIAGGSGLSGAYGLASSTNGETFRVGDVSPTLYLARGYFQQTFSLDNDPDWTKKITNVEDGPNQLHGKEPVNYLRLMIGKFGLADIFDNNQYASSPRSQFINWSFMNNAAWDYAANTRGYTYSIATIVQYGNMSYRAALAALPLVANGPDLNTDLSQAYSLNGEITRSFSIKNNPGHIRVLGYYNTTNMGNYKKAIAASDTPDVESTKTFGNSKTGFGINIDQQLEENIGFFFRFGWNDGKNETWCYTEADKTYSFGIAVNGAEWNRTTDNLGFGVAINSLSTDHKNYLKAGGLGFELGDGTLTYAGEAASEIYYNYKVRDKGIWLTGDYQFVMNPGYNKDRGPVNVFSVRVHVEL